MFIILLNLNYLLNLHKLKLRIEYGVKNDFLCKNFILNGLFDNLYNYYNYDKYAKKIWNVLQKKYYNEETGIW